MTEKFETAYQQIPYDEDLIKLDEAAHEYIRRVNEYEAMWPGLMYRAKVSSFAFKLVRELAQTRMLSFERLRKRINEIPDD